MFSLYHQIGMFFKMSMCIMGTLVAVCGLYECLSGCTEVLAGTDLIKILIFPFALISFPVWYPFYLYRKSRAAEDDPEKYKELYLGYKEKRDDILERFRSILSQGGSLKPCPEEPGKFLTVMPDGETGLIDFGYDIKDCFAAGVPECIESGTDPDSLLASSEVMIIRSGKYDAEAAAEHIVEKTVRACEVLEFCTCVYAPEGGRTLIGIDNDGEVRSVMLDLPVHRLFKSFAGTEPCGGGACIYEPLMDSVVSKEELAAEGR